MAGLEGFRELSEATRFEGSLFCVATVRLADPDGHEFSRDVVRHPGAVSVVPLPDDGSVTLVRQVRVAVGEAVLEAPAGTCDVDGEPPEATAHRELAEEAGLRARNLVRVASLYNSPGYTSQRTIVYLASGIVPCETDPDGAEERWMTTEMVRLDDVERLIASGRLVDATTIVGLLLARGLLGGHPSRTRR